MVSMLTSSAVDYGFEPQLGKTKDFVIGICLFSATGKHVATIIYVNSCTVIKYVDITILK
jgi:hypothetical protein